MGRDENPTFFIGVDGGGSRTRVRIQDRAGTILAGLEGGSANVYLAFDAALASIADTIGRAASAAGLEAGDLKRASVGLGLAGISSPAIGERVADALAPRFGCLSARNDGIIACLGAHAGQDGGLVIAGTGSAAILRLAGRDIGIGGRGFLLGDDGSAAVMGRTIWQHALRAHDGLEPATPLLRGLMAEFDHDPVAVITWGRHATSAQFGRYAPRVLEGAQAGDPVALAVTETAARAIAELINALARRAAPRIALVGGLAIPLLPFLPSSARDRLQPALHDALSGALLLAGASIRYGNR